MSKTWPVGRGGEAHYTVEEGMVEVVSRYGRKATQVGDSPPAVVARLLFRELLEAAPLTDQGA